MGLIVTATSDWQCKWSTIDLTAVVVELKLAWQSRENKALYAALRKKVKYLNCARAVIQKQDYVFYFVASSVTAPFFLILWLFHHSAFGISELAWVSFLTRLLCNCSVDKVLFPTLGVVWLKMASLAKGALAIKSDTPVTLLPNNSTPPERTKGTLKRQKAP